MKRIRTIIMGAAGRDFHNFNVIFANNLNYEIIAFTAYQIPNIENRKYPNELAGKNYPKGIPIYPEEDLPKLIKEYSVDLVVFSYSDISHEYVMHRASIASSYGANFLLLGVDKTMIKSKIPVIAVCAVRTGAGKSQTSRKVLRILKERGFKITAVRHPMPYGDLTKQAVQRFETYGDFSRNNCTFEEREEYEPYIEQGLVVYSGIDYKKILKLAEDESEIIVWDGGNNDTPFFVPDLHIVVVDPHRPGHETSYYPGETNFRMADVLVVNKLNTAKSEAIKKVMGNIKDVNPKAVIVKSNSVVHMADPHKIKNKRVLVIEDGPTVTHGNMAYGAGMIAAKKYGASEIIDPRSFAVGSIKETFNKFTHLRHVLPAMGYGKKQINELEETINNADCDAVIIGTPINLIKLLDINKPAVRVTYDIDEVGSPSLNDVLDDFIFDLRRTKRIKGTVLF